MEALKALKLMKVNEEHYSIFHVSPLVIIYFSNQSINQSISQSVSHSVNQPISQSVNSRLIKARHFTLVRALESEGQGMR